MSEEQTKEAQQAQEEKEEKSGGLFGFWNDASPIGQTAIVMGGLVVLFVLSVLIAVILGIVLGDSDGVANTVSIIRDLFIILLAAQGMLIGIALVVLILQIAAIINLVENELKPVAHSVKETADTIKGTAEFMSENVASPVIESQAWLAGFAALVKEATSLRKAFRKDKSSSPEDETSDDRAENTPTESDTDSENVAESD